MMSNAGVGFWNRWGFGFVSDYLGWLVLNAMGNASVGLRNLRPFCAVAVYELVSFYAAMSNILLAQNAKGKGFSSQH